MITGHSLLSYLGHLSLYIITLLCILLMPSPVRAEPLSLSISPPLVEITTQTDRSITKEYVLNNSGETVSITPQLFMYSVEGIDSQPLDPPDPWIRIVTEGISWNEPFVLKKNEQQRILVSLRIPRNLEQKDYYRALVFSTNPSATAQFSQSLIRQRIATILLLTVSSSGLAPSTIQFSRISFPQFIDSFGPLDLDMDLKNAGSAFARISGTITLRGPIGSSSYSLIPSVLLGGETKHVLSSSERTPDRHSTLTISGLYLGRYQAEAIVTAGEGSINIYQKKSFYAFPWKGGLVLIGVYIAIRLKRKWLDNARKSPDKQNAVVE